MRYVGDLGWLSFAAIRQTPDLLLSVAGHGIARVPEFGGDPRVGGVPEHPAAFAVDDLIGKLGAELKVEPFVVDAPVAIFFFFQAEDGIRDLTVTGVQTCALPI